MVMVISPRIGVSKTLQEAVGRCTRSSVPTATLAALPAARRTLRISSHCRTDKPSIASIGQLRKMLPGTTMSKAKEALSQSDNDIQRAVQWLEKDALETGAKKASKLGGRQASEGGIAVCVVHDGIPKVDGASNATSSPGIARASIVELNCETDFVGRNEIFQKLLFDIAHTVAMFPVLAMADVGDGNADSDGITDISVQELSSFPLIPTENSATTPESVTPKSVGDAILDVISRLGERIHLARACAITGINRATSDHQLQPQQSHKDLYVASSFSHGGQPQSSITQAKASAGMAQITSGSVGSLLLTRVQVSPSHHLQNEANVNVLRKLARSLARQAAGMPTRTIRAGHSRHSDEGVEDASESALYAQPFVLRLASSKLPQEQALLSGVNENENGDEQQQTVEQALRTWSQAWIGTRDVDVADRVIDVHAMRRWQLGGGIASQ